jgi:UDPglucose 6-dehydrogenase
MAKYTANAYLATRITFINQIADLCQKNGADIQEVIQAIGYDQRIGPHYWYPGLGYGGSCFPKDVRELAAYSRSVGEDDNLLVKVNQLNEDRIPKLLEYFKDQVGSFEGKQVAVLGLAFKPNTDDTREAPSLKIIPWLLEQGARVTGFDPKATLSLEHVNFTQTTNLPQALEGAQVILALIEWPEILSFDFVTHKPASAEFFIDVRNQFNRQQLEKAGYIYRGVGR